MRFKQYYLKCWVRFIFFVEKWDDRFYLFHYREIVSHCAKTRAGICPLRPSRSDLRSSLLCEFSLKSHTWAPIVVHCPNIPHLGTNCSDDFPKYHMINTRSCISNLVLEQPCLTTTVVPTGEDGRPQPVPERRVHGLSRGLGARPHAALHPLHQALGRLLAGAGHHVRLRHLRRLLLLRRQVQGAYTLAKLHSLVSESREGDLVT